MQIAEEGDKIKVIGFIGNDLIYGIAHATDIYQDAYGETIFPMYKINVVLYNEKNKEKKEDKEKCWLDGAMQVRGKIREYLWSEEKGICLDRDKDHRVMDILTPGLKAAIPIRIPHPPKIGVKAL